MNNKLTKRTKTWLLVFCLQISFLGFITANKIIAQELNEIELRGSWKDMELGSIFDKIEDQTDFYFTFTNKSIDDVTVTNNSNKISLASFFDILSDQSGLEFSVKKNNIYVLNNRASRTTIVIPNNVEYIASNTTQTIMFEQQLAEQEQVITGKVLDNNGGPLIGVTVRHLPSGTGAITDLDGSFSVTLPDGASNVLTFSYVGYKTKEVKVSNGTVITLELDQQSLDDVLVVGYGYTRKK